MRITRRHLRRIIKEEICRITEIGPGVGMDPTGATMPVGMKRSEYRQLEDAQTDAHSILAAMSIADPTVATDLADAALYALEGNSESAALVLVLSAGGIGAGALAVKTAKMVKGMKAAGVPASKAAKAADDVVTAGKNLDPAGKSRPPSKLPRQKKATTQSVANIARLARKVPFASRIAKVSDDGYQFVAVKYPGGSKIYYRSSGTNPGLGGRKARQGQWLPTYGMAIIRSPGTWPDAPGGIGVNVLKGADKFPPVGSLDETIGKNLDELSAAVEEAGGVGLHGLDELRWEGFKTDIWSNPQQAQQAFSDMAGFNHWMREVGADTPHTYGFNIPRSQGTPGLSLTLDDAIRQFPEIFKI